jgi:hypothetical protein
MCSAYVCALPIQNVVRTVYHAYDFDVYRFKITASKYDGNGIAERAFVLRKRFFFPAVHHILNHPQEIVQLN